MFVPGSTGATAAADREMRAALADSLGHIHSAGIRPPDRGETKVAAGLDAIRAHRVGPALFGRYYDLVFAVRQKRYGDAGTLLAGILDLAIVEPTLAILPFTETALGADIGRYGRLLDPKGNPPALLAPPSPEDWDGFEDNVVEALSLIEAADPNLAAELRHLVVLIVGAAPPRLNPTRIFGGASSFMLWGAVFLNVERHRKPIEIAEGLVHEAAHQLLFAWSRNDPLVRNAVEERFDSPLRRDPRPMIGVYHATFVCARIHYLLDRLRKAEALPLSGADQAGIDRLIETQRRNFRDGLETVRRHGRLTDTGARIIDAAAAYMVPHLDAAV